MTAFNIVELNIDTWLQDLGFRPGDNIEVTGPGSYNLTRPTATP